MTDMIIIGIIGVLVVVGLIYTRKHFKGEGGCCGGGGTYVSKKKLKNVAARRTVIVEGMTCENCKAKVERFVNDLDGVVGKVNLKKKELVVSMEKPISDVEIKAAIEKAGYEVVQFL